MTERLSPQEKTATANVMLATGKTLSLWQQDWGTLWDCAVMGPWLL